MSSLNQYKTQHTKITISTRRLSSERQQQQQLSIAMDEDDNNSQSSQASDTDSVDIDASTTAIDPLNDAIGGLLSSLFNSLETFKAHSGVRTNMNYDSIHAELKETLRPVLEIAAHVGPATARSKWRVSFRASVDEAVEEVYQRVNEDFIFPELLTHVQSDVLPARRAAALAFFHNLYNEYKMQGSYLDYFEAEKKGGLGYNGILYGPMDKNIIASRASLKLRTTKKTNKSVELLRYWMDGSTSCMVPGVFSDSQSDGAIASRAVISASAVVRPVLRHIAEKISNSEDTDALKLYIPVMRMIGRVLQRLFVSQSSMSKNASKNELASADSLRSACIKFLEIVVLCFSSKDRKKGRQQGSSDDFSLDHLPMGHEIITRQALEEIGEDAFTILRGLASIGGQIKIDPEVERDVKISLKDGSPSAQVLAILKPAALSYLQVESNHNQNAGDNDLTAFDRSNIETDFNLSSKSYALNINAISMLASNRPTFFKDSAICLARRAMDPPTSEDNGLNKAQALTVKSHLRASCLTLLRNSLSITNDAADSLHTALCSESCNMTKQADKAMNMAKHAAHLKTAGRKVRNEAAIFYEWDQSKGEEAEDSSRKRKAAGHDALERLRMAKKARGLGNGIQLPTSMADACELILLNLSNLPSSRAAVTAKEKKTQPDQKRKRKLTLDYLIDAIVSNGASLVTDESRWYQRDGGDAWMMDIATLVSEDEAAEPKSVGAKKGNPPSVSFSLDVSTLDAASGTDEKKVTDEGKLYNKQCQVAAADAFERILSRTKSARGESIINFGNELAARLAWSMTKVEPSQDLKRLATVTDDEDDCQQKFCRSFPLVSSCLKYDLETFDDTMLSDSKNSDPSKSLSNSILNEAYINGICDEQGAQYNQALEFYISSILRSCKQADEKPNDSARKKIASSAATSLPQQLAVLPSLSSKALELTSALCDIDGITKKAVEASRKASNQNLAQAATVHAAKSAAEKRAKGALLALRDAALQRTKEVVRNSAVDCAVGITTGRLAASQSVEEMALRLVMNVLYPKSPDLADKVIASVIKELERAANYAIENCDKIKEANKLAQDNRQSDKPLNPSMPQSDEEKKALEIVKKPANIFIAICIRKPEMIKNLMIIGSKERANVLNKGIRNIMSKLTRPLANRYGAATIALQVADMVDPTTTDLLFSFLDSLAPLDGDLPSKELIDACHEIQTKRISEGGEKDTRYIVPVLSGITRQNLIEKLPEFVAADNDVFKATLRRMSERHRRHTGVFRELSDTEGQGMTLCEQIVFLHRLDFAAAKLPQKRYLDAIKICLEDEETFNDRIILAALDQISKMFLVGERLPLAYMRTIIMTCSKHESLHPWICNELLPRLIDGEIYNDRRQWEGWMRAAKMLENTGDAGVSSLRAIQRLPEEQFRLYRAKYPQR